MARLTATRVFLTVVEQGSRYLAAMEGWLGARLLHRTTRRLSLTEVDFLAERFGGGGAPPWDRIS